MSAPLDTRLGPVDGRVPAADLDAEAAVLSASILDQTAADEAMSIVKPEHFYADANRRIFQAIVELVQEGSKVDLISVRAVLENKKRLDQIGGTPYLVQIIDATPAVAHVGMHARIVLNKARIRRACETFQRLAAEAYEPMSDVNAWLQKAEVLVYESTFDDSEKRGTSATYHQIARETYKMVVDASKAKATTVGYRTGFKELDEHVGGWVEGDLWFIAGRPGQGKTAFSIQCGENVAAEYKVGIIALSAEMQRNQLMQRTLSRETMVPNRNLKLGKLDSAQWQELAKKAKHVGDLPIVVDDDRNLSPTRVRSKVRRRLAELKNQYGQDIKLGAVIIDYVQLMVGDNRSDQRAVELGEISRSLKIMAGEFQCTFVVLSQLRRAEKGKSKRPELSDLRDSGSLEADADVVMAIHREDTYRQPTEQRDGLAELLVLKGRNSGEGCHVVEFDGRFTSFYERSGSSSTYDPTAERYE